MSLYQWLRFVEGDFSTELILRDQIMRQLSNMDEQFWEKPDEEEENWEAFMRNMDKVLELKEEM